MSVIGSSDVISSDVSSSDVSSSDVTSPGFSTTGVMSTIIRSLVSLDQASEVHIISHQQYQHSVSVISMNE